MNRRSLLEKPEEKVERQSGVKNDESCLRSFPFRETPSDETISRTNWTFEMWMMSINERNFHIKTRRQTRVSGDENRQSKLHKWQSCSHSLNRRSSQRIRANSISSHVSYTIEAFALTSRYNLHLVHGFGPVGLLGWFRSLDGTCSCDDT